MRSRGEVAGVILAAAAVILSGGRSAPASLPGDVLSAEGSATGRKRVALPEEDPNFVRTLDRLGEQAALYRKHALGFSCREVVTVTKYDLDSGGYRKSDKTAYDYLFEEQPRGSLREVREEMVEDGEGLKRKSTDFEPPVPPAYSWATLFSRENRGRFHFRPAGQVVKAYRLLTLINFVGTSPNPGGGDIAGWSGQVALEARSLNLWSVEAAPSGEEARLEVEIFRYRKAFAIMGVPLASRPHGWKLSVSFGIDVKDLSYPTEQTLSMTSLSRTGTMKVEEKTTFRYEDYRFFDIKTGERVEGTEASPRP